MSNTCGRYKKGVYSFDEDGWKYFTLKLKPKLLILGLFNYSFHLLNLYKIGKWHIIK